MLNSIVLFSKPSFVIKKSVQTDHKQTQKTFFLLKIVWMKERYKEELKKRQSNDIVWWHLKVLGKD